MALDARRTALAERLAAVPLFRSLDRAERSLVAAIAEERHYPVGAVILRGGEFATEVFVLLEGQMHAPATETVAYNQVFVPFAAFGVSAVVEPLRYRRDLIADVEVIGLAIPVAGLVSLMESDDSIGMRLWRELARELRGRITSMLGNEPNAGGFSGRTPPAAEDGSTA